MGLKCPLVGDYCQFEKDRNTGCLIKDFVSSGTIQSKKFEIISFSAKSLLKKNNL